MFTEEYRNQKLNKRKTKIKPTNPFEKKFHKGYLKSAHGHPTIALMKETSKKIVRDNLILKEQLQKERTEKERKQNQNQPKKKDDKKTVVYKSRKTAFKFPHHLLTADFNMPAIIRSNPYYETLPEFLQDIVVSYTLCNSLSQTLVKANLLDTPLSALDQEHLQYINDQAADYLLDQTKRILAEYKNQENNEY